MRIISVHGFPLGDDKYEGVDRSDRVALEKLAKRLQDYGFQDGPFTVIGDNEIPRWVRDYEARLALGEEE